MNCVLILLVSLCLFF